MVIIFATAMLPVRAEMINSLSKMCSGARRSFYCRMKCKVYDIKEEADTTTGSKYTQSGIKIRYIFYHCVFNGRYKNSNRSR